MESTPLLDCVGRRRSPATTSSFHQAVPRNRGLRYPPDPPTVEEIIAVMHAAGEDLDGLRLRSIIVVLWRAGLRISEALALTETDLDPDRGALLVRRGKGGKRREVGMDRWGVDTDQPVAGCSAPVCPSARCSASCVDRLEAAHAPPQGSVASCTAWPGRRAYADASRPTNCVTPTRSRCRVRACRSS